MKLLRGSARVYVLIISVHLMMLRLEKLSDVMKYCKLMSKHIIAFFKLIFRGIWSTDENIITKDYAENFMQNYTIFQMLLSKGKFIKSEVKQVYWAPKAVFQIVNVATPKFSEIHQIFNSSCRRRHKKWIKVSRYREQERFWTTDLVCFISLFPSQSSWIKTTNQLRVKSIFR